MFKAQKLNLILILLPITFLSSCRSFPWPKEDTERCVIFLTPVQVEEKTLWDGKCRCHAYRISKEFLGRSGESYDMPVEYCKRLTGFRPETWTDFFVPWFQEIQIWDSQNKGKE